VDIKRADSLPQVIAALRHVLLVALFDKAIADG
jgi:hypothetical protein